MPTAVMDVRTPPTRRRRHVVKPASFSQEAHFESALTSRSTQQTAAAELASSAPVLLRVGSALINVLLHDEDGAWTAADSRSGLFGSGSDFDTAIKDLIVALAEHQEVLSRSQPLSPGLQEQLAYLESLNLRTRA